MSVIWLGRLVFLLITMLYFLMLFMIVQYPTVFAPLILLRTIIVVCGYYNFFLKLFLYNWLGHTYKFNIPTPQNPWTNSSWSGLLKMFLIIHPYTMPLKLIIRFIEFFYKIGPKKKMLVMVSVFILSVIFVIFLEIIFAYILLAYAFLYTLKERHTCYKLAFFKNFFIFFNPYILWSNSLPILEIQTNRLGLFIEPQPHVSYMMDQHIQYWLKLSGLNNIILDELRGEVDPEILAKNSSKYYVYYFFDLYNIQKQSTVFNAIFASVRAYFSELKSHHRNKDIQDLYSALDKNINTPFIFYLWSIEIFKVLSHYRSDFVHASATDGKLTRVITMIEAVSTASTKISTQIDILWAAGVLPNRLDNDLIIQKTVFQILHKFAINYKDLNITLTTKKLNNVKIPKNLMNLNLKEIQESSDYNLPPVYEKDSKAYVNISVFTIEAKFTENPLLDFNIWLDPGKIIGRNCEYWVVSPLWCIGNPLVTQRQNKEKTTVNIKFTNNIQGLLSTKYFIHDQAILQTNNLVELELERLEADFCEIYSTLSTNYTNLELPNKLNVLNTIKTISNIKTQIKYKKLSAEKKIANSAAQIWTEVKPDKTFRDCSQEINTLVNLIEAWAHFCTVNKKLSLFIAKLQKIISHTQLLTKYIKYIIFLKSLNVPGIYFPIYADFRGRLYYNSTVSVQTYWCFRFIYSFGPISEKSLIQSGYLLTGAYLEIYEEIKLKTGYTNPNYLEIFQSLGFLFKKTLTQPTGEINLKAVVLKGLEVFLLYRNTDIKTIYTSLKCDPKLAVEVIYYMNSILRLESGEFNLFYIWKDTTCSMAQHAGKLLGYQPTSLKYLNLENDTSSFDTYQIYINSLKEILVKDPIWTKELLNLLSRDCLKNLIMTSEYGVTLRTARKEFIETISSLSEKNPEFRKLLPQKYIDSLFNILRGGKLDLFFYKKTKEDWINSLFEKNITCIEMVDLNMPVGYYHKLQTTLYFEDFTKGSRARKTISVQFNVARNLELYRKLLKLKKNRKLNIIDMRKTKSSTYVNTIHALDALYLRHISKYCQLAGIPLAVIHDGFGVPFTRGTWILSTANACFWQGLAHDQTYFYYSKLEKPEINSNSIIV